MTVYFTRQALLLFESKKGALLRLKALSTLAKAGFGTLLQSDL